MGDTFISICCFQRLFFPLPYNNIFLFFSLLLWCRGRSMSMRRMVDRGEIVAVAGARDAGVGTPPSSITCNNELPTVAKQPPGPRMPDGTRGFSMGRGKPVAVNIA